MEKEIKEENDNATSSFSGKETTSFLKLFHMSFGKKRTLFASLGINLIELTTITHNSRELKIKF